MNLASDQPPIVLLQDPLPMSKMRMELEIQRQNWMEELVADQKKRTLVQVPND